MTWVLNLDKTTESTILQFLHCGKKKKASANPYYTLGNFTVIMLSNQYSRHILLPVSLLLYVNFI